MMSYFKSKDWDEAHPLPPPAELGGAAELLKPLSPEQILALASLQASRNFSRAAKTAGVTRQTVHRWYETDPHFRAACNAWKQEQRISADFRLHASVDGAIDTLVLAAENGDVPASIALLKAAGVMNQQNVGATTSRAVSQELELRDRQRAAELEQLRLKVAEMEAAAVDERAPAKRVESIAVPPPAAISRVGSPVAAPAAVPVVLPKASVEADELEEEEDEDA